MPLHHVRPSRLALHALSGGLGGRSIFDACAGYCRKQSRSFRMSALRRTRPRAAFADVHARDRIAALYARQGSVHFAPERRLSKRIAASNPSRYVRCDLYPQSADVIHVDMLAIPFDNESFDFVIANHVLEHVDDDLKALAEIRRVLRIGGYAILQTPYSNKLHHTWQDAGVADDQSRLQVYGQEDHVRLFGRDIFQRFEWQVWCRMCASMPMCLQMSMRRNRGSIQPSHFFCSSAHLQRNNQIFPN